MKHKEKFKGLLTIDCEGPLTKNDNALELSSHLIPEGKRLFTQLSRYDDILAFMVKRPGYRAGNTLKLICPFFRAYGIQNSDLMTFSEQNILIMPGADIFLKWINRWAEGFIISTSYHIYIHALCDVIGFPVENTYSTHIDLDLFNPSEKERQRVKEMARRIVSLPYLDWTSEVRTLDGLSPEVRDAYHIIDAIFSDELAGMGMGKYLESVEPVGGSEKAKAVQDACERFDKDISECIYIGDSITDVEAFMLVKESGGMTVSFNGNRYAIEAAEVACLAYRSDILSIICKVFWKRGREGVDELIDGWGLGPGFVKELFSDLDIGIDLLEKERRQQTLFEHITETNRSSLIKKSESFRSQVRGEEIGRLG